MVGSGPTDMRRGFEGLAVMVEEVLKRDPHCGDLFVFRGKRGGLIKVLWHNGQGMAAAATGGSAAGGRVMRHGDSDEWELCCKEAPLSHNGAVTPQADAPLPDDIETLKAVLLAERQAHRAEL